MYPTSDPYLNAARGLKRERDAGHITGDQYRALYAAVAAAAESESKPCDNGDGRAAYLVLGGRVLCATCADRVLALGERELALGEPERLIERAGIPLP